MNTYVIIFVICVTQGLPSYCTSWLAPLEGMIKSMSYEYSQPMMDMFTCLPDKSKKHQKEYSCEELQCLDHHYVINCKVYDFNNFPDMHGGPDCLKKHGRGCDATKPIKTCKYADQVLHHFCVGRVKHGSCT